MNNVILILMDSVHSECLGTGRTGISSTPFIDKLISEGVYAPNVYSYGPYTDAATKGFYCGTPTLDDYGYYFQINASEYNHFRIFKENGYETYGFYYPYYLVSPKVDKYIDHSVFISGMLYKSFWNGKLSYYSELKKCRDLNADELMLLKKAIEMLFDAWIIFYKKCIMNKESIQIISENIGDFNIEDALKTLELEYEKFKYDNTNYTNDILHKGMNHPLATLDRIDVNKFINKKFLKRVYRKHKRFFNRANIYSIIYNLRNNKINKFKAINGLFKFIKTRNVSDIRYLINYYRCLTSVKEQKKLSLKNNWQEIASAKRQITTAINMLEARDSESPFFMSFHFLEAHNYISYFSYDITDDNIIFNEINTIDKMINHIGKKFKGNLVYQFALRYLDSCIERLFFSLEKLGLDKNTTLLLVSDHGTSYSYFPLRTTVVNNFHKENYNVPMVIWQYSNRLKPYLTTKMYSADDIFPTLFEMIGIAQPEAYKGHSILDKTYIKNYIITEYMGPGCPDMIEREVWISARDTKYMVAYKIRICDSFDKEKVVCIYDLIRDPNELNNYKHDKEMLLKVDYLVNAVEQRFLEIQSSTESFIINLRCQVCSYQ